ncbi:endonuclease/exonuclease/phosphatase family protein [Solitalea lacus]|uniref:endonuclease/exonuclease/phosphatase family protein n=1 Tax=Solitalea lacus TaxID=2911172 RepID=UPI001EDA1F20|nr:endonuclease/exonuclease/phosphatase family protein [Solitalea lacus]UKJ06882.1 endonuclease/exonuclease/phosphatase family protein [Solitalea lacus]
MKYINKLVLLMLLLIGAGENINAANNNEKPKDSGLRVMTYNVHHCNPPSEGSKIDLAAIARVINAAKPDLVALQEIDVHTSRSGKEMHQARELARLTGMYSFFAKGIDFQGGEYGIAVLSKYPVLDSVAYALPMQEGAGGEPRALAVITVALKDGRKVKFAATHLDLKPENRMLQVQKIAELFKNEKQPVILCGDFNAVPGSEPINYTDQFFKRSCMQNCAPTIPVINPDREIDFIMYTPSIIKVLSHQVISETYASDHLPVVAELKLK